MLGKLIEQAPAGRQPGPSATVAQLPGQYMAIADLDISTRDSYEGYIWRTILPGLGRLQLRKARVRFSVASTRGCGGAVISAAPASRSPSTAPVARQPCRAN